MALEAKRGARLTLREQTWLFRAIRIARGVHPSRALHDPVSTSNRNAAEFWYQDLIQGVSRRVSQNDICTTLMDLRKAQTKETHYNTIHRLMIKVGCLTETGEPQGAWSEGLVDWTFHEKRMVRFVINRWRAENGHPTIEGGGGDHMADLWLRGARPFDTPSDSQFCKTIQEIYDERNTDGQTTISEMETWDNLIGKICVHKIPLTEQDRDTIRTVIHAVFDPGIRISTEHWVRHEREELCDALHEQQQNPNIRETYRDKIQRVLDKLMCPAWTPEVEEEEVEVVAAPVPAGPVTSALSPYETKLVDWMLRQRWYDKKEDAVAHVIRMREAGVIKAWRRGNNLDGLSMLQTMERFRVPA